MVDMRRFDEHNRALVDRYGDTKRANQFRHEWWPDRVKLVHEQFPSTDGDEGWWRQALGDYDLMGAILRDILRLDMNDPRKEGRRFEIGEEAGAQRLRQLMGRDYTSQPFIVAFGSMTMGHSLTQVARKTGISRSRVHRMLNGDEHPNRRDLEAIAKSYGKRPSFFREYRTDSIVRFVLDQLEASPEFTADIYRRLTFS